MYGIGKCGRLDLGLVQIPRPSTTRRLAGIDPSYFCILCLAQELRLLRVARLSDGSDLTSIGFS